MEVLWLEKAILNRVDIESGLQNDVFIKDERSTNLQNDVFNYWASV